MEERQFPIMNTDEPRLHETLPWSCLEPYEDAIKHNHGQSLETLASRGGMSWYEVYAAMYNQHLIRGYREDISWKQYRAAVLKKISGDAYIVPVEWTVCGFVLVNANSAEEACKKVEEDNSMFSIPQSPYATYLDDSFHVSGYEDGSAVDSCLDYTEHYKRNPRLNLLNDLTKIQDQQ